MFSVGKIRNQKKYLVIRTKWIEEMAPARTKNVGNRPSIVRTIFHSPDQRGVPNFAMPILPQFRASKTACYKGYVIKTFGKYFHSIWYYMRQETILLRSIRSHKE